MGFFLNTGVLQKAITATLKGAKEMRKRIRHLPETAKGLFKRRSKPRIPHHTRFLAAVRATKGFFASAVSTLKSSYTLKAAHTHPTKLQSDVTPTSTQPSPELEPTVEGYELDTESILLQQPITDLNSAESETFSETFGLDTQAAELQDTASPLATQPEPVSNCTSSRTASQLVDNTLSPHPEHAQADDMINGITVDSTFQYPNLAETYSFLQYPRNAGQRRLEELLFEVPREFLGQLDEVRAMIQPLLHARVLLDDMTGGASLTPIRNACCSLMSTPTSKNGSCTHGEMNSSDEQICNSVLSLPWSRCDGPDTYTADVLSSTVYLLLEILASISPESANLPWAHLSTMFSQSLSHSMS